MIDRSSDDSSIRRSNKVFVFAGGTSSERDVSLSSGLRITMALRERGHSVTMVDTVRGALTPEDEADLASQLIVDTKPPSVQDLQILHTHEVSSLMLTMPFASEADVIFLALHGGAGEDGTMQAFFDLMGVAYTGSGHLGSAIAMDKDLSKRLFRAAGVPTADWLMLDARDSRATRAATLGRVAEELGYPLIVKPSKQGSTVGLSLVNRPDELDDAIDEAFRFDDEVMLEAFIQGRELTVAVLGDQALPVGEIFPEHEIYDYECKYTPGMVVEEFPAPIDEEVAQAAQRYARAAFTALKLHGCARVDFRMRGKGELYCLEVNTLPGMTPTSLVPQAAVAAGISFPELCDRIVQLALARKEKR